MNHLLILVSLVLAAPGFFLAGDGGSSEKDSLATSCIECHPEKVGQDVMHPAADDACDNCHQATGESHPSKGVIGFTLAETLPDLCFICHEAIPSLRYGHHPVEEGECISCHDAHGSSEPGILKQPEQALCLSCHKEIRSQVEGKGTAHSAIETGGCIQCHRAHGSDWNALLVEPYPVEEYVVATSENFGLCFLCHDTGLIESEETDWATGFRNGTVNLHWYHINGNKGRNCKLCHNLHGSTEKFLISKRVVFGKWEMDMNFIPSEGGGTCLPGCHGSMTYER